MGDADWIIQVPDLHVFAIGHADTDSRANRDNNSHAYCNTNSDRNSNSDSSTHSNSVAHPTHLGGSSQHHRHSRNHGTD